MPEINTEKNTRPVRPVGRHTRPQGVVNAEKQRTTAKNATPSAKRINASGKPVTRVNPAVSKNSRPSAAGKKAVPGKKNSNNNEVKKRLALLASALLLLLVIVIVILVSVGGKGSDQPSAVVEQTNQPPAQTQAPVPTATPKPDYSTYAPMAKGNLLPVFWDAETTEKRVAITVDDLNQPDNLKAILDLCEQYNAKVTLFALGQNIKINSDNIKRAYNMGIEIENHGFDHSFVYSLEHDELITQVAGTGRRVNDVLGLNYQMHFMRPPGGNGRNDPRLHAVLAQGNYYGVAYWSLSGTAGAAHVMENIAPGDVILYHTTDEDVENLRQVIPYLSANGYEMVTMNELFGYPDNEITEYDASYSQLTVPLLYPYTYDGIEFSNGTRMYGVKELQTRLGELGYLTKGKPDGDYGNNTEKAVKQFQKDAGLKQTGVADEATRAAIMNGAVSGY